MRHIILALLLPIGSPTLADTVFAARTVRAQTILTAQDLTVKDVEISGAARDPAQLIGKETRLAIYAGRPVRLGDVGPPAVVERNDIVPIVYQGGGLSITAVGRALQRAGVGEFIRVMNRASRSTVTGKVMADGRVMVSR